MKKWMLCLVVLMLCVSCGDSDSEDFDPTRLDIVTGMNVVSSQGNPIEQWGNPNVATNINYNIFPKPAFETITITTSNTIEQVWLVRGEPTQNFPDTNFSQVLSENPYRLEDIEANAFRSFDASSSNVTLLLSDITPGYYRLFIQLQNGSLIWDNIYVQATSTVNFNDINFWDILNE